MATGADATKKARELAALAGLVKAAGFDHLGQADPDTQELLRRRAREAAEASCDDSVQEEMW